MKKTTSILILMIALAASLSCTKEQFDPETEGSVFSFASYRKQVLTRADADLYDFASGTKYTLFAVHHADNETLYEWISGKGFATQPQEGEESEDHTILYQPKAVFPQGVSMDFFGLTFGTGEAPEVSVIADGTTPVYTISETDDRLPDLLHSNEVKSATSADGIISLPFEHALSALNFQISKQDESDYSVKQLESVTVSKIWLEHVSETATMNLVTGAWTASDWKTGQRVVYDATADPAVVIGTTPQSIGPVDLLVVPNAMDPDIASGAIADWVNVCISLEGLKGTDGNLLNATLPGGEQVVGGKVTLRNPLRNNVQQHSRQIVFERNHKYILSIIIGRGTTRVVEIIPQVYEWQDVNLSANEAILGQPVTFGGVVWMDRNLGATSPDCDNDWWHSCGYFYQYGRNIPYIINVDGVHQRADGNDYYLGILDSNGNERSGLFTTFENGATIEPRFTFRPFIYQTDEFGNVVPRELPEGEDENTFIYMRGDTMVSGDGFPTSGRNATTRLIYTYRNDNWVTFQWITSKYFVYTRNGEATYDGRQALALNPGDKGSYEMVMGYPCCVTTWAWDKNGNPDARAVNYWWNGAAANGTTTPQVDSDNSHLLASYPQNQPVPKGWRLPRRSDGYTILPEPAQGNRPWTDSQAYLFQGYTDELPDNVDKIAGLYRYQYIRGRVKIAEDATGSGLTDIMTDDNYAPCIYGIKHQGTDRAYRIRIRMMESSRYPERYFIRIEQFPATSQDIFKTDVDPTGLQNGVLDDINVTPVQPRALSRYGHTVTQWNIQDFDWEHASGHLDFPLQGYIDAGGLDTPVPYWNQIGICTIMRLPEHEYGPDAGYNWTFYMRNATSGVAVGASSRRSLGDCIRLVRDFDAN